MMVKQLSAMMQRVWNAKRHICENFTPHKGKDDAHGGNDDSTECTGGKCAPHCSILVLSSCAFTIGCGCAQSIIGGQCPRSSC